VIVPISGIRREREGNMLCHGACLLCAGAAAPAFGASSGGVFGSGSAPAFGSSSTLNFGASSGPSATSASAPAFGAEYVCGNMEQVPSDRATVAAASAGRGYVPRHELCQAWCHRLWSKPASRIFRASVWRRGFRPVSKLSASVRLRLGVERSAGQQCRPCLWWRRNVGACVWLQYPCSRAARWITIWWHWSRGWWCIWAAGCIQRPGFWTACTSSCSARISCCVFCAKLQLRGQRCPQQRAGHSLCPGIWPDQRASSAWQFVRRRRCWSTRRRCAVLLLRVQVSLGDDGAAENLMECVVELRWRLFFWLRSRSRFICCSFVVWHACQHACACARRRQLVRSASRCLFTWMLLTEHPQLTAAHCVQ
jgi:hypothetical protein